MSATSPTLLIFHAPGSCSRVTMNALEELELTYEDRPIDIFKGAQQSQRYRAINPKGKVPALQVGEQVLTETPAILLWLTEFVPGEALLPCSDRLARSQALADIEWCAGTLHPITRALRIPQRFTLGDPEPVRAAAEMQLSPLLQAVNQRLSNERWWLGDRWSVIDVYVSWILDRCAGGMDLSHFPAFAEHRLRVRNRPSFQRALDREMRALAASGIELPGGDSL